MRVSIYPPLAAKDHLTVEDLHGENFLLIRPGLEPVSGPDAGRAVAGPPPDPHCGL